MCSEKEDRDNVNKPKERDYEKEQLEAIAEIRKKEDDQGEADVKQKNEGYSLTHYTHSLTHSLTYRWLGVLLG